MTADFDIALLEGKTLAGRDADLFGYDINPGDEFCHRMLDLYAGVHFNEVELTVFVEEFERAGTAVADSAARFHAAAAKLLNGPARNAESRGLFNDFLIAALH